MSGQDQQRRDSTLENDPGLEHQHATPEGELMTATGSTSPTGTQPVIGKLTLENDPGLEHQHATPEGEMMTATGSTGPAEVEDDRA
jgi:hypothetical protein